jgi:hypothetical protein
MADPLKIEKPKVLDILDTSAPALSSTSDIPVVETKPDASNEGKPPTQDKAAPDEGKTPGESATPAGDETPASDEQAKKPAKGVQKRLDELTRQREEAERRAKAAEENLRLALEAQRIRPERDEPAKPQEDVDPEPKRPVKSEFPDPDAWDAALLGYADEKAAWTARREVKAARLQDEQKRQQDAQAEATRVVREAHNARVEKARAKYADYTEVAESPDVSISIPMAHAILTHEQGPDLQYYLGSHKTEAERIASYTVPMLHEGKIIQAPDAARQLLELGILAAQLRAQAASPAQAVAAPPAKPITAAPAPIKPQASGTADTTKPIEEMTMEEYAEYRKPKLAAERRPGARRSS